MTLTGWRYPKTNWSTTTTAVLANTTKSTAHESITSHVGCTIISVHSRAPDAMPVAADLMNSATR
ncbi:hypothetical protein Q2K19_32000 [Micromonospora soli]|uniref:hypothetical protein n=1 Tax=Micromonospora sp. NBRC 110009 TaxID=3061627 RepID=UPI0026712060|nr:hypothetical protein [Micromonospora sp. NBRC 110009]WKU02408.1 hypothetical protein Q2K19_32000 [Micromonospora sp. NBRC 110009]